MSREAYLRPECADLYPALHSGKWEPVAIIVDKLIADLVLRQRAGMNSVQAARRLTPEHFEFRDPAGPSDASSEGSHLQPGISASAPAPIPAPARSAQVAGAGKSQA